MQVHAQPVWRAHVCRVAPAHPVWRTLIPGAAATHSVWCAGRLAPFRRRSMDNVSLLTLPTLRNCSNSYRILCSIQYFAVVFHIQMYSKLEPLGLELIYSSSEYSAIYSYITNQLTLFRKLRYWADYIVKRLV